MVIFPSNFVYLCILTLSSHCHAKRWRGFVEHHFGQFSSFSENAHNSRTPWYIHFKFCILMFFNIFWPLPSKTGTRLCRVSFWQVKLIIIYLLRIVHITVSWFLYMIILRRVKSLQMIGSLRYHAHHCTNKPLQQYTAIIFRCKNDDFQCFFFMFFDFYSKHELAVHVRTACMRRL